MTSPTQRTLAECKKRGWIAQVVERWNPWAKRRIDLLGFIDVVAIGDGAIIGIQCTTTGNAPARVRKICEDKNKEARAWVKAGGRILTWGWARRGKKGTWTLKEYPVTKRELVNLSVEWVESFQGWGATATRPDGRVEYAVSPELELSRSIVMAEAWNQ